MKKNIKIIASFFVLFLILSGASCEVQDGFDDDRNINGSDSSVQVDDSTELSTKDFVENEVENENIIDENKITSEVASEVKVKEFNVLMSQFTYDPSVIEVNLGDKVIIHATSVDVSHDFSLSDFDLNLTAKKDETITGEFIANKKGEFLIRCSVYCGVDHNEMHAKLIVK